MAAKEASDRAGDGGRPAGIKDGIRKLRAKHMGKSFPGQQMLYRDFIGDEQGATTYYIGLFDGAQKQRQLALFSVSRNGIKAEKALAAQAASKGRLADIKSVKSFLAVSTAL